MRIRKLLYESLKRHFGQFLLGSILAVGNAWVFLRIPLVVRVSLDNLHDRLFLHAVQIAGLAALSGLFMIGQRMLIISASRRVEFDLRNALFSHLLSLPSRQHKQWKVGDQMALCMNDLEAVRMMIGPAYMYAAATLAAMAIAIAQMLHVHPLLTAVALSPLPFIAAVTRFYGLRIHWAFRDIQTQYAFMSGVLQEDLSHIRELQGFGKEGVFESRFRRINLDYYDKNKVLIRFSSAFYPVLQFFIALGFILILFYGGHLLQKGIITFGNFAEFHLYLARLVWPMIAFGWVANLVQRGLASSRRIEEILQVAPDIPEADPQAKPSRGLMEIRNLSQGILKNISLEVEPGSWVGIAGESGSGKTTLLNVLARVEEPPPGTILLDGTDIRTIPLERYYDFIGMVPQESFLFSATFRENAAFGKPQASEAEVLEAVRSAGLEADLNEFSEGLETLVGERGVTLSGGQRQRLSIARALLRSPSVLILDDCLSSVDVETERLILKKLKEKFRTTTTILASHRMKVFSLVDRIFVLEQGAIIASGTHEALLKTCSLYARLWELQQLEEELQRLAN